MPVELIPFIIPANDSISRQILVALNWVELVLVSLYPAKEEMTVKAATGLAPKICSNLSLKGHHSQLLLNFPAAQKILLWYRYISWLLTSLFYFIGVSSSTVSFRSFAVLAVLVAGATASYLYDHTKENPVRILGLVIVETLGIGCLLIPTGGLESPFMWYALNPILISAILLPRFYCWGVLAAFFIVASAGSVVVAGYTLVEIWQEKSWLVLVFLLVTTAVQLFVQLLLELSHACEEAAAARRQSEQSLEHVTALYEALEAFSSYESPRNLAALLADYSAKLTGSPAAVCYLTFEHDQSYIEHDRSYIEKADPHGILNNILQQEDLGKICDCLENTLPSRLSFSNDMGSEFALVCIPVQSSSVRYGFLGFIETPGLETGDSGNGALFLSNLAAVVLERRKADDLAARLLVTEEQNRIANEIHDGAAQHLFSIVYALHALAKKEGSLQDKEVQHQLELLKTTANRTAKELRESIYRISPLKRGEQAFILGLRSFFTGIEQLNDVKVSFLAEGSEDNLSPELRKALYRIVNEAASNAIRHGRSTALKVVLRMSLGRVLLKITDDGGGFDPQKVKKGLGLANMTNLIASFGGEVIIESEVGRGSTVTCIVPGNPSEVQCAEKGAC